MSVILLLIFKIRFFYMFYDTNSIFHSYNYLVK